jgi:phosphohistidine phosphatase
MARFYPASKTESKEGKPAAEMGKTDSELCGIEEAGMKTLLILRHAKAEPDAAGGDKDRALNKRGRGDAEAIGRQVQALVGSPDAIVSSDARRARQTAELAASAAGFAGAVTLEPDIYDADPDVLLGVVGRLPDEADSALLVGHNPGCELLAELLAGQDARISPLPTAGLVHLELDAAHWRDVGPGSARFRGRHTP